MISVTSVCDQSYIMVILRYMTVNLQNQVQLLELIVAGECETKIQDDNQETNRGFIRSGSRDHWI